MGRIRHYLAAQRYHITEKYMVTFNSKALDHISRLSPALVKKEGDMANLTPTDTGLVVMSGPLPYTSLFYSQVFNTKLYVIDKEISSCIKRRGLTRTGGDL